MTIEHICNKEESINQMKTNQALHTQEFGMVSDKIDDIFEILTLIKCDLKDYVIKSAQHSDKIITLEARLDSIEKIRLGALEKIVWLIGSGVIMMIITAIGALLFKK